MSTFSASVLPADWQATGFVLGLFIVAFGLAGAAIHATRWLRHHWLDRAENAASKPNTVPTVKELFEDDFRPLPSTPPTVDGVARMRWDCGGDITVTTDGVETVVPIEYKLNDNYTDRSRFLSFYVPATPHRMAVLEFIGANTGHYLEIPDNLAVEIGSELPGSAMSEADLKFTGRVFLYYEGTLLSLGDLGRLDDHYKKYGLLPEFRGTDYALRVSTARAKLADGARGKVAA